MTTATNKLKLHKGLVIQCLRNHPEDVEKVAPAWQGTAEELISELETDPRQWIVDGELSDWIPDAD